MIQAEQVKNRRVEIVDMNGVAGNFVPYLVGGAVSSAGSDSASSQEAGKRACVMASSSWRQILPRRPAKLRAADDQGFFQEPPLFDNWHRRQPATQNITNRTSRIRALTRLCRLELRACNSSLKGPSFFGRKSL